MKKTLAALALVPAVAMGATVTELEKKIDVLASEVAKLRHGGAQTQGLSKDKVYNLGNGLSIGGYGEITYTNKSGENEKGDRSSQPATADALRNILYVGYKFDEKWTLNTEIEIEHANKIYLEFAHLDYHHSDALNFRAGVLLTPMGWINETHEPTTFFSVNRPEIENKILPTTWREHGLGVYGKLSSFNYKFYIMNSLDGSASNFGENGVRDGRQKASNATADHFSYVARVDYTGLQGLVAGASAYVGKLNGVSGVSHNIFDFHAEYQWKGLKTRALYTWADLDGKKLNEQKGGSAADKMQGYYIEAGYDVMSGSDMAIMPFVRYETYNTQEEVPAGVTKNKSQEVTNITYGVQFKPIDRITFKVDYVKNTNEAETGRDSFNLGMGWHF
ncbi:hypothetical protein HBN50_02260 [Halobacteriovorax sp. GB3]|uniref:hypothetical protein n=1 Tax=Halobacteriovorax sp. GB3 TaxID=2719615 RepID=UPI00236258A7|nr:hypothetical protein [Halobacteriovorax sp. GB3]MDD0851896.1 hypothetical protein [Halobacteriovorax sp. GB3]